MNRRHFIKSGAAATAAMAAGPFLGSRAFAAANPTYPRTLHFMYPQLKSAQGETYQTLTAALNKVKANGGPGVSFLSPGFLNVTNFGVTEYVNFRSYCNANGIKIGPACGYLADGNKLMDNGGQNTQAFNAIDAAGFQPYLRVDNLSGYYQNAGGETDIKNFLTKAVNHGFTNIMLNPWPRAKDGSYMRITESNLIANIDSSFQNASYQDYKMIPEDIDNIVRQSANWPNGSLQIIGNYESPGPQGKIANMTYAQQTATFDTTLNDIKTYPSTDHIHMAFPFTGSYDPLNEPNANGAVWTDYMVPKIRSWTQGA